MTPISGSTIVFPLRAVIELLARTAATGRLVLQASAATALIAVRDGRLLGAGLAPGAVTPPVEVALTVEPLVAVVGQAVAAGPGHFAFHPGGIGGTAVGFDAGDVLARLDAGESGGPIAAPARPVLAHTLAEPVVIDGADWSVVRAMAGTGLAHWPIARSRVASLVSRGLVVDGPPGPPGPPPAPSPDARSGSPTSTAAAPPTLPPGVPLPPAAGHAPIDPYTELMTDELTRLVPTAEHVLHLAARLREPFEIDSSRLAVLKAVGSSGSLTETLRCVGPIGGGRRALIEMLQCGAVVVEEPPLSRTTLRVPPRAADRASVALEPLVRAAEPSAVEPVTVEPVTVEPSAVEPSTADGSVSEPVSPPAAVLPVTEKPVSAVAPTVDAPIPEDGWGAAPQVEEDAGWDEAPPVVDPGVWDAAPEQTPDPGWGDRPMPAPPVFGWDDASAPETAPAAAGASTVADVIDARVRPLGTTPAPVPPFAPVPTAAVPPALVPPAPAPPTGVPGTPGSPAADADDPLSRAQLYSFLSHMRS